MPEILTGKIRVQEPDKETREVEIKYDTSEFVYFVGEDKTPRDVVQEEELENAVKCYLIQKDPTVGELGKRPRCATIVEGIVISGRLKTIGDEIDLYAGCDGEGLITKAGKNSLSCHGYMVYPGPKPMPSSD